MAIASLVRMANQIAANYQLHPIERAAEEVATHLRSFWAPSMRAELFAHVDSGADGVDPVVIAAVARLRAATS